MGTYSIKLQHENLVPNSEVITIPGGQYVALVRDEDYTIDYINGIVNVFLSEKIVRLRGAGINDLDLDIAYNRQVDFSKEFILDSHIEVFNEVATIADLFEIQVKNGPIGDVFRVFNKTTGENYTVESFFNKTILIGGVRAPTIINLTNQESILCHRQHSNGKFLNTVNLVLPDRLIPAKEHAISSYDNVLGTTGYKNLIRGSIDIVQDTYEIDVTPEVVDVEIYTGSTILRRANQKLIDNVDYYATVSDDGRKLTLTLTESGRARIATNSVFYFLKKVYRIQEYVLHDAETILDTEHRFTFAQNYISEVITFDVDDLAQLSKFEAYIEKQQEVDVAVYPTLIVTNQSGATTYEEGKDYTIDKIFKRLVRIPTSTKMLPHSTVKIVYIENESFTIDSVEIAQDVVVVDYDYGTNSLDWSPSFKEEATQEIRKFVKDLRFFRLTRFPANSNVSVYKSLDGRPISRIKVLSVDVKARRIEIEPLAETGNYIVEYTAREQVFDPDATYYVSYRYGARRKALIENFATLLSLSTGNVARTETFDMINGQSSVSLSFAPTDPSRTIIYVAGDPDKMNVTTIRAWDPSTYTLEFVPLMSSGVYTVEYQVLGYETENLRKAIIALLQAFNLGPTKRAVELLVEALTDITPDVKESLENGFNLTNDSTSDYLVPIDPIVSPLLSDDTSSISFVPSRFNNGIELRSSNNAWIGYSALNNISVKEGTFSFLLGTLWDGNDERSHYLFDLVGTDEATNRMTLYKNKNSLLSFEIFDKDSKLHRVTANISRIPRNVVLYLKKGQRSVQLPYSPVYSIVDFNSNNQSDMFEANETEFMITPVFGGPTGLKLGITTLIQIPDKVEYATEESEQNNIADKLRALADVYEEHDAKLTIQTELSFIVGCYHFDNVLKDLHLRGHDVHLYLDIPADVVSDEEREVYILERRNALTTLGIGGGDLDGVAGGYIIDDFATRYSMLGFDYVSAYIDPISQKTLGNRTDVFRASTGQDFSAPSPEGKLIYLPGDMTIDFDKNPITEQSFIPITNSLITAVNISKPDMVNTWYFVLKIDDFESQEVDVFDVWLENTVDQMVRSDRVVWRTLSESVLAFRDLEQFLRVNYGYTTRTTDTYGYGYGVSKDSTQFIRSLRSVRALQWDQSTKTLTFDRINKAGYYLFSYISGFSKFEEAEHLITCTWKLHTDDNHLPIVKMFLDGDLISHKVFGDL